VFVCMEARILANRLKWLPIGNIYDVWDFCLVSPFIFFSPF